MRSRYSLARARDRSLANDETRSIRTYHNKVDYCTELGPVRNACRHGRSGNDSNNLRVYLSSYLRRTDLVNNDLSLPEIQRKCHFNIRQSFHRHLIATQRSARSVLMSSLQMTLGFSFEIQLRPVRSPGLDNQRNFPAQKSSTMINCACENYSFTRSFRL